MINCVLRPLCRSRIVFKVKYNKVNYPVALVCKIYCIFIIPALHSTFIYSKLKNAIKKTK